jgi:glycosyltransferase involved in cell wall biosynthesis
LKTLSICIPTFNRSLYLNRLLQSIFNSEIDFDDVEFCISDNSSTDDTLSVLNQYTGKFPIQLNVNKTNIGMAKNILKVVDMASSKFVWILGDDDILISANFSSLLKLIKQHSSINYFYLNSLHCNDINIINDLLLDDKKMQASLLSQKKYDGVISFIKLINPNYSFDFLGGIYLSVFNRQMWKENLSAIDYNKLDSRFKFSTLENTFPHLKIFSVAFSNSEAYFSSKPFTVNLSETRDWAALYPIAVSYTHLRAHETN